MTVRLLSDFEATSASNQGAGGGVFKQKSGQDLQFRSLLGAGDTSITVGTDEVTITGTGRLPYTEVTGTSQALAINNAYGANNAAQVVFTLPASAAVGTRFAIVGFGAGGWRIAQNGGQNIRFGDKISTTGAGGYLQSTNQYDTIELLTTVANTTFQVVKAGGNPQFDTGLRQNIINSVREFDTYFAMSTVGLQWEHQMLWVYGDSGFALTTHSWDGRSMFTNNTTGATSIDGPLQSTLGLQSSATSPNTPTAIAWDNGDKLEVVAFIKLESLTNTAAVVSGISLTDTLSTNAVFNSKTNATINRVSVGADVNGDVFVITSDGSATTATDTLANYTAGNIMKISLTFIKGTSIVVKINDANETTAIATLPQQLQVGHAYKAVTAANARTHSYLWMSRFTKV